ncbi:hypothetical protein EG359_18725 [Chryseobacterium joostei]|uniref:Transposase n=1 Tax=Chryseobacterium joostei TaxID=112234 RepID=A0ABM7BT14_9FLAO|nr:hypothetical protein EG359_18725 [Chryseobacterium joostei]
MFQEKSKSLSRAEDLYAKTRKYRQAFSYLNKEQLELKNIIYKILGKNKVCQAQKVLYQTKN